MSLASVNGFSGPVNLIPSVFGGSQGVAVNARMNRVYAVDWQSSSLIVIDGTIDKVIARIPVVERPNAVAIDQVENKTYVTSANYPGISVIDEATNTLAYTIDAPAAYAITIDPVTSRIYSANNTAVTAINAATGTIVGSVAVGFILTDIAVNTVTNLVYVASEGTNDVYVIDGSTMAVVATIQVTNYPRNHGLDVNPKTNMIYVTNSFEPVSVIDGTTNTVVGSILVHGTQSTVVVNSDLNEVYVADQFSTLGGPPPSDEVAVLNATSKLQIGSVVVGSVPSGIGLDPMSGTLYVDNENSDTMSVIDISSLSVRDTITLDPTIRANPSTVTLASGGTITDTITVTTYPDTRFGTYNFMVMGNSSSGDHSIMISVTVGDFTVSDGTGFWTIPRGATISDIIDVRSRAGSWTVNMTATTALNLTGSTDRIMNNGTAQDVKVHFTPSTLTIAPDSPAQTAVAVSVPSSNPIANYTLTIIGTSGSVYHDMSLVVRVVDFTVASSPPKLTIEAGSSARALIEVAGVNGFSGYANAQLSTPSGLNCYLNATQLVLILGSHARPLVARAAALMTCSGIPGNYTVVVTVTSYIQVHSVSIPVRLSQPNGGGPTGGGGPGGIDLNTLGTIQQILFIAILLTVALLVATVVYFERQMRRQSRSSSATNATG